MANEPRSARSLRRPSDRNRTALGRERAHPAIRTGPYIGYELHLAVQIRDVTWTNYIDRTRLTDEVAGVITTCSLVPAGTHRAKAVVDRLLESSEQVQPVKDVVWDPGYSLCQPETTTYRLGPRGVEQTLQPVTHQRGIRPFAGEALLLDGQLFSPFLPAELRDLPIAPRYARGGLRRAYEEPFNRRARYRYVRHAPPDRDGVTRWKCPFCAGLLRSRSIPETMRRSRRAPLVELPKGVHACCHGRLSAPPAELPLAQKIPFGTTAWRTSMNRRQVVESANAALKGGFTDVGRGYVRVFGLTKLQVLLGFTIAAYNLDRIRSFVAKRELESFESSRRAKRRLGTWSALVGERGSRLVPRSGAPPG